MAPNPRRVDAKLEELYRQVPAMVDCRGLCADSCGPIDCSVRERQRVEADSGRKLEACPVDCSLLTPLGRCSVYSKRPMICRLFGTSKAMRCEHGCSPERWLTDDEFFDLMVESMIVGGPPPGLEIDRLRGVLHSKGMGETLAQLATAFRLVRSARGGSISVEVEID